MKLNCDLGESDHIHQQSAEHQAMPYIDMANIACGFHAGNAAVMAETIALALQHRVSIGAHPSYPDRENFGRLSMSLSQADICDVMVQQLTVLSNECEQQDTHLSYIKPHGALYHDLLHKPAVLTGILKAISIVEPSLPLLIMAAPASNGILQQAKDAGIRLMFEAFSDRRYETNGQLQSRSIEGSVLAGEAALAQAKQLIQEQTVTTDSGNKLALSADSLCVHGDNPEALAQIQQIRGLLCRH